MLVGDGMADYPVKELANRTPLEAARTPNMDFMARNGIFGLTKTIPEGMNPGSDTANLSIFGYNPAHYYTGRAPLEALNMGIELGKGDVAFRCNIVNISSNLMSDFTADHIDTAYTRIVINELIKKINIKNIEFYPGVSYRNILVWRSYPYDTITDATPPHDIQGMDIDSYLPQGPGSDMLRNIMKMSGDVIAESDMISEARSVYKGNPSDVWLWGGGRKPAMESLKKRFGIKGYTISAVDLIHGIGRAAGLSSINVKGATGYIDTDYDGKAEALIEAMDHADFIFLHVESPDESGHEGNLNHKIKSIEDFDAKVVGRVLEYMKKYDDYAVLVMPDHPTPVSLKTHTSDPVPFAIYNGKPCTGQKPDIMGFNEKSASAAGVFVNEAHRLIEIMISGKL